MNRAWLVGKLGFGESIDKMIHNFNFPVVGASGPVAAVVLKRTDVFVAGPARPATGNQIRSDYRPLRSSACFRWKPRRDP